MQHDRRRHPRSDAKIGDAGRAGPASRRASGTTFRAKVGPHSPPEVRGDTLHQSPQRRVAARRGAPARLRRRDRLAQLAAARALRTCSGKVVLADFWTYTCINWLRTLAYVRAWADRYAEQGLVVVGVHTPEFPFERDDRQRPPRAAKDLRVDVPDRARQRLRGLAGVRQPLLARRLHRRRRGSDPPPPLRRGRLRRVRDGRSSACCARPDAKTSVTTSSPSPPRASRPRPTGPTWSRPRPTSATSRAATSPPRAAPRPTSLAPTRRRTRSKLNQLGARRRLDDPAARLRARPRRMAGSRSASTPATSTSSWARVTRGAPCRSGCSSTASRPATRTGSTSTRQGNGTLAEPRLYQLIRQPGAIADRTFEIAFLDPAVEAYVFTFG